MNRLIKSIVQRCDAMEYKLLGFTKHPTENYGVVIVDRGAHYARDRYVTWRASEAEFLYGIYCDTISEVVKAARERNHA
jgi:hypothetical protein